MSAATPIAGETLTTTNGVWNGFPTSFSYQWQHTGTPLQVATVSGSYQLQNAAGQQFVARGVVESVIGDNGNNSSSNSFFANSGWSNIATIVATEQAAGVNLVRLRVLAGYYNSLSSAAKTAYVAQVVSRLAMAKSQGAVLMICPWDGTDSGPTGFNYSDAGLATSSGGGAGGGASGGPYYSQLYPLQNAICTAVGNDPDLIWDLVNEPNDQSTGAMTSTLWQTMTKGLVNNLRTVNEYTGVIVADPINWSNSGASGLGYSDTDYTAIETYDAGLLGGHHQIVFATHQYWYPSWAARSQGSTGGWSTSQFTGTQIGGTTKHCILVSEIGNDNDAGSPGTGVSSAWSNASTAALAALPATQANIAGTVAFIGQWVDDNTLWSISNYETLTSWGTTYNTNAIAGPFAGTPGFANITGATANTYVVQSTDLGKQIAVVVTATNTAGSKAADAAATGVVGAVPTNTTIPTIAGVVAQGDVLTATPGVWAGSPTSFQYQWFTASTSTGGTEIAISGATAITFTPTSAQAGDFLFVRVTAINGYGSATQNSGITSNAVPSGGAVVQTAGAAVSGTFQVGDVLTCTPGTYTNATSVTHQWVNCSTADQGVPADQANISGATGLTYTLQSSDSGLLVTLVESAAGTGGPLVDYVWGTIAVAASGGGGGVAQTFFTPSDPFNAPIVDAPVLDANNTTWQSKFTSMFSSIDTSSEFGWPLYFAQSSDPVFTCDGGYQNARFHLPSGAEPSGDDDGHMLVIAPSGLTETEMGNATVNSGASTVTVGDGTSPCQFNVSTTSGSTTRNICGDNTIDGNTAHTGSPGSCRGCGISCLAGLVLQAEFIAALAIENAGGRGVIPHALCATCSWTASTFRAPAIISDGGTSGGIPEGARIQLDPTFDVSGYPAYERVIAHTLQDYGFYVTDSTGSAGNDVVFEAQVSDGTNATYSGLDEQNGNTIGSLSMWAHMRVLRSWDGT